MTAKKQRGNNDGAVLLTVLTVACFAAILLTAVLSFVGRAHTNAYNNYNSEQAYYIASSALGSIHDYFEEADGSYTKLLEMANANSNAGTTGTLKFSDGSDTIEMSELVKDSNCTVKVSRMGDGYIKLSVTGYCRGQAETINAYYTIQEEKSKGGIDNALYSNGNNSIDVAASTNGPFTSRDKYQIRNVTEATGTVVTGFNFEANAGYTWKNQATSSAKNYIVVGHNLLLENNASFLPETLKVAPGTSPDNTSQFIAVGGKFSVTNGPTQVGDVGGKDMDVYCSNFDMSSNSAYTQYGNVYCYKLSADEFNKIHSGQSSDINDHPCDCASIYSATNGRFYLNNTGDVIINGSVYVDGEFLVSDNAHKLTITNDLYLSPGTEFKYNVDNFYDFANNHARADFNARLFTIGKLHAPDMTDDQVVDLVKYGVIKFANKTEQWHKDLILHADAYNADSSNSDKAIALQADLAQVFDRNTFSHDVPTARETKPNVDFIEGGYERQYESTADYLEKPEHAGIKNAFETVSSDPAKFSIDKYKQATRYSDADLGGMEFDYVINSPLEGVNGCVMTQGMNGADRHGSIFVDMNQINNDYVIVFKGDLHNGAQQDPKIIVKNGIMDDNGNWIEEPKHNLYIITAKNDDGYDITFDNSAIFDYYTYKYAFIEGRAINLVSYIDQTSNKQENRIFAKASDDIYHDLAGNSYGVYTPAPSRTYLMLYNDNDTLTLINGTSTPCTIEATIYAPNSKIFAQSYGFQNKYFLLDSEAKRVGKMNEGTESRLSCLGAIVCNDFSCQDNFSVAFIPPSPDAGLGGSSTSGGTTIKFSHYESR